ncbi:MAG TPA: MCP four helix bundle domain-containing protein [Clostridia bacterium]|nr:MCP four helix bundle domain-containing protein [Clostridia bacterium]
MKISVKLITGFLIVALIAGAVGVVGIVNLRHIERIDKEMYNTAVEPMGKMTQVLETYHRMQANLRDMVINKDSEYRIKAEDKIKELEKILFDNLTELGTDVKEREVHTTYEELDKLMREKYLPYRDEIIALLNS